jgi:membrane associated rhomboid family serine protease
MRIPALGAPLMVLIASIVGVTLLGWIIPPLRRAFILVPARVRAKGEVWRLFTAGWVHASFGHLAVNMLALYFFAEPAIRGLGLTPFLALYISAVPIAFIPSTLQKMHRPAYATLGASGAIAAVMFSAVLLNPKLRIMLWFIPIPIPAMLFAVGYLALTAWQAYGSDSEVNHTAHFAGAIYGVLFTYAFEPARVESAIRSLG